MTLETNEGIWVVPPLRAVWIPAETAHGVTMSGRVSMRTLYLLPGLCRTLPRRSLVINTSSLLRELILHACQFSKLRRRVAAERHVIDLILDQLKLFESIPVQLPHPHDSRARKLADRLRANPREQRPLETLSMECGASKRTMQRLFAEESGMSFSRWRQRARLIHAMQSLAAGAIGHQCRARCRLQYDQRIHLHVPQATRNYAGSLYGGSRLGNGKRAGQGASAMSTLDLRCHGPT